MLTIGTEDIAEDVLENRLMKYKCVQCHHRFVPMAGMKCLECCDIVMEEWRRSYAANRRRK